MVVGRIKNTELSAIAAAIRSKNGESTAYKPSEMGQAILDIPTGGSSVIESKSITENGTYTAPTGVDGYSPVTVAVLPNLQSKTATENGTVAPDSGYDGLSSVVVNVSGGGSAVIESKNITANGTYTAPTGVDGYSPVVVDVANSYAAGDEGKVVSNGALVAQGSDTVTQNGTVDTTLISSLTVNVSGGGGGAELLYSLDESQSGVWVNTNVDVTNFSAFLFKRYNGDACVGIAVRFKSQIAVYTGGSDVYTTIFNTHPDFNVRIYNNLLYVSYNGTGAATNYVDVYDLEV